MRNKLVVAVFIVVAALSCGVTARAQAVASNDAQIRQLRGEIQKREALDRDANTPESLRETNRGLLASRRAQLVALLRAELDKLSAYKTNLGSLITPDEDQKLEDAARNLRNEIRSTESDMQAGTAGAGGGAPLTAAATDTPNGPGASATDAQGAAAAGPMTSTSAAGTSTATPAAGAQNPPPTGTGFTLPQPSPAANAVQPLNATEETASDRDWPSCSDVTANPQTFSQVDQTVCTLVANTLERRRGTTGAAPEKDLILTRGANFFNLLVVTIAKRSTPAFLVEAEGARVDKQIGSETTNEGSTSLVMKGGAPAILGFAVENGALTRSITGTTVTFRGNPLGLINTLANKGFISNVASDRDDAVKRFLRKVSFGFSFDTDRGTEPGVFTGTKQQLSAFTSRVEFVNNRKPELYVKDWEDFVQNKAQPFTNSFNASTTRLIGPVGNAVGWTDPAMQRWYEATQAALAAAPDSQVEEVLKDRLDKLPVEELSDATVAELNGIEQEIGTYISGRDEVLDKIAKGTIVTFDYTLKREVNAPDTSNFIFIAEKGTAGRLDLTFNGSLTMFNSRPLLSTLVPTAPALTRVRRLRDFQFAGQLDVPFGSPREAGQFLLWASGRYERLLEDAATQAGAIVPNTKGDIGVLQLGLMIPIKGLGMRFPVSVSFANRTELITEKEVRGNFGFTLDLDAILARFKPF